jgi:hypothetical protein
MPTIAAVLKPAAPPAPAVPSAAGCSDAGATGVIWSPHEYCTKIGAAPAAAGCPCAIDKDEVSGIRIMDNDSIPIIIFHERLLLFIFNPPGKKILFPL